MALLGVCASSAACARSSDPVMVHVELKVQHYRLANGLEVVLEEDHHAPEVAIDVRYHVGSKDDPPGRSGLAHLVEHVTFAATRHVPKDGVIPLTRRLGTASPTPARARSTRSTTRSCPPASSPRCFGLRATRWHSSTSRIASSIVNA